MAHSNGIITAPISFGDVNSVLGTAHTDLASLCTDKNINQWSKPKPVTFPYIEPSRTSAVSAYGKTLWWWKGNPSYTEVAAGLVVGNYTCTSKCVWITCCGVKYLGFSSAIDVLKAFNPLSNAYHNGDNSPLKDNYSYVPPTGGINAPYRLADFNNYSHDMPFCILPDISTETGTELVNQTDPNTNKVKCGIDLYDSTDTGVSPLSFDDLFAGVGTSQGFTVVLGVYSGNNITSVASGISITATDTSSRHKEVTIDFSSSPNNTNYIGIYCARISVNSTSYYVPVMQSSGDRPNTLPVFAPRRRCFKSWHVENVSAYYPVSFQMKVNYGTSNAWYSNPFTSMQSLGGSLNRIYFKVSAPRKSSGYYITTSALTLEMDGMFYNPQRGTQLTYYTLTASDTRFVIKNSEPSAADWGTSDSVYISAGTGTQTFYLAVYDAFKDINSQVTTHGGTIWRITLGISQSSDLYVTYGSLGDNHLNISVSAV